MVRLSKKGVIFVVLIVALVLGATGYLFWRVNLEQASIAPFDISADSSASQKDCGGCATVAYEWKWSSAKGRCVKSYNTSKCGKPSDSKAKNNQECGPTSAGGCKSVGQSCGNGGTCVNKTGTKSNDVQCSCQGGVAEAPKTVVDTNTCEGGAITSPATGDTGTIGEGTTITGYAFDADGINKTNIVVNVDGVDVGTATATDACPSGNASICSSVGSGKKPVIWSYDFTPTSADHEVTVFWVDSKGKGGDACTKSTTLTSAAREVTSANWTVNASGSDISCQSTAGSNTSGIINYAVTVKNSGDAEGNISRVEIVLDDAVEDSYVMTESISPSATVAGGVITWDLSGSAATFAVGKTKTYEFSLNIPKAAYGTFVHNVSVVTEDSADTIDTTLSKAVSCADEGSAEVPETGIFDSAIGQIVMAFVLISLGYLYLNGYDKGVLSFLSDGYQKTRDSYEKIFGDDAKIAQTRRKFERKIR